MAGTIRTVIFLVLGVALFSPCVRAADRTNEKGGIHWESWSDAVFERAKKENKFVLLDLEAVWCHWCHVMDEKTYGDPKVIQEIQASYIAVRVDQDSRPDLSNRYEDYGWPATVVFKPDGSEIVKRSGYIPPEEMISMLKAIVKDPTPGPSVEAPKTIQFTHDTTLTSGLRKELSGKLARGYDPKMGGWGVGGQKFLEWDNVDYCLTLGALGNYPAERMARQTLAAQTKLIDPIWGGVYQYSTDGDWEHPHYEKLIQFQGENMRIFALAFCLWNDMTYLQAAQDIHRFVADFLMSPEGAFYTSMDADLVPGEHASGYFELGDAARRKKGIPRIDKHIYSRENGIVICGLAALYGAIGGDPYRDEAIKAADWIIANRAIPGGGFRHDAVDPSGPYLGDTLQMGRAFLALYSVTADRKWLKLSEKAANFIEKHFKDKSGYATADTTTSAIHRPAPQLDENVVLARFTNRLFHYTGNKNYRAMAEHAMGYLSTAEIARARDYYVGGILLADRELSSDPLHITVTGPKNDPIAIALFGSAVSYPGSYKRVEWWDKQEGPLPNPDVEYPNMKVSAAFVCTDRSCSSPIFKADELRERIDHSLRKK